MPEAHKRAYRHPQYKTASRVTNWRAYDQALHDRGNITLWLSREASAACRAPKTGKRGGQSVDAAIAIETTLALRLLFPLPLHQTEDFLRSILTLMDVPLPCPDHMTLLRRHATVEVRKQVNRASQGPLSLIVDSSGLQVCGQGAWHDPPHVPALLAHIHRGEASMCRRRPCMTLLAGRASVVAATR